MLEGRIGQDACRLRRPLNHADPHRKSLRYCVCHHPHNHALDAVIIRLADLRLYAFAGQRFLRRWFIANQPTRSPRESIGDASLDVKAGGGKQQPPAGKERCFTTYGASVNRYRAFLHPSNGGITQHHGSRRLRCLEAAAARRPSAARPPLDGGTDGARTSGKSRLQGDPADPSCDHMAEPARLSRHGLPHRRDIDAVSGLRGIFRCRRDAVRWTLESVIAFVMWSISFRLVAGA
jgi:hypothetical protein